MCEQEWVTTNQSKETRCLQSQILSEILTTCARSYCSHGAWWGDHGLVALDNSCDWGVDPAEPKEPCQRNTLAFHKPYGGASRSVILIMWQKINKTPSRVAKMSFLGWWQSLNKKLPKLLLYFLFSASQFFYIHCCLTTVCLSVTPSYCRGTTSSAHPNSGCLPLLPVLIPLPSCHYMGIYVHRKLYIHIYTCTHNVYMCNYRYLQEIIRSTVIFTFRVNK